MLSQTVRPLLAEQYADMLAQNHRMRGVLLSSHSHTPGDLTRFDQRMLKCLKGMTLLKGLSSAYLRGQLQEPLSAGELFATALFAASTDDEFLLSGCIGLSQALPRLLPVLLSVAGWMPAQSALWPLMLSLPACRAYVAVVRSDLAASVAFSQQEIQTLIEQGRYVDFLLNFLCRSTSPLFVPALETVFCSGRDELILQGCRAVLCSHPLTDEHTGTAIRHLVQLAHSKRDDIRLHAVRSLLTCQAGLPHSELSVLTEEGPDTRLRIQAMGWSGLPGYIPSLLTYFDSPEYARLSVLSVIAITGSLPEQDGWLRKRDDDVYSPASPDSADIPARDPEQGVGWPERAAFADWWRTQGENFAHNTPYLCGQLTSPEGLNRVLRQGYLNLRPLALLRLGIFPERAALPAERQKG
ncbi:TPA: hypothetical protein NVL72_004695 [Citrobacter freundii]|nr:hypothetical protein [Citrobacter freundii]HCJ7439194.1 hypothetical protein [Citrobacter freundii]HCK3369664.1 hypothetical protein [Citrobacter freundii]